jgi:hypothetical protein
MRTSLFRLFIVGSLLVLLCLALQSSPASAHTSSAAFGPPSRVYGTITYLKRGNWGNYYFAPTYIYCRVYAPCVTIINVTGRTVLLLDQDNSVVSNLWSGRSTGAIAFYHPGIYSYTDVRQNIRVPLTIYVQGGYWRGGGYGRVYSGWRR